MKFNIRLFSLILFTLLLAHLFYCYYPEDKLPIDSQIDKIVVYKSKRQLLAYSNGKLLKTYTISLGKQPIGPKEFEGDKKTPEGVYFINDKNSKSSYHKNLGISYPNKDDLKNAKNNSKPPGAEIKIHGLKNGLAFIGKYHRWFDWTLGCIAVTNEEMDELYRSVYIGTEIQINP